MMKIVKKLIKGIGLIFALLLSFVLVALLLTYIPFGGHEKVSENKEKSIYINSNNVHLDIIMPKENVSHSILNDLKFHDHDQYLAFGWGDKNFYLSTPEWSDLIVKTAFNAMFIGSRSLMHVSRYFKKRRDWIEIKVSDNQLAIINEHIKNTFYVNKEGEKSLLPNKGYTYYDDFYDSVGGYSCLKTSNTWVNSAFKKAELKACLWTPFSFRLISMHQAQ